MKTYLDLTCSVKLGIQNTNFKVMNEHKNHTCHVHIYKKTFTLVPSSSFYHFLPTSKNMVNLLANLNITLCHDFIQDKTNIPLLVSIVSNSSKDQNQHANTHVVSDDDETN